MPETRVNVRIGDDTYAVDVIGDDRVRIEAEPPSDADVLSIRSEPGAYRVSIGGRTRRVFVAGTAGRRWVFCEGTVYEVEVAAGGRIRAKRTGAHTESLSAPMPATVVRIVVEPGRRVARGDTLLMLEAMKMELPVRAPHDGVVKRILCREGELVQPGVSLLEFADAAAA